MPERGDDDTGTDPDILRRMETVEPQARIIARSAEEVEDFFGIDGIEPGLLLVMVALEPEIAAEFNSAAETLGMDLGDFIGEGMKRVLRLYAAGARAGLTPSRFMQSRADGGSFFTGPFGDQN